LNQPSPPVSAVRIEFQGEETPEYGVMVLYIQNDTVVKEVELSLEGVKEHGALTVWDASLYSKFVAIIMGTGPPLESGAPPVVGNYNLTVASTGAFLHIGDLNVGGVLYPVMAASNSTITAFNSNTTAFWFNVSGPEGSSGWCNLTVPVGLNQSGYVVFVGSSQVTPMVICNGTHYFIYFTYTHSEHRITVATEGEPPPPFVPEFQFFLASVLLMAVLLAYLARGGRIKGAATR
jgi:hypothetical protein